MKKFLGLETSSLGTATLIIWNKKLDCGVVRFLEDSVLLRNGFTQTIKNETKNKYVDFLVRF